MKLTEDQIKNVAYQYCQMVASALDKKMDATSVRNVDPDKFISVDEEQLCTYARSVAKALRAGLDELTKEC